MSRLPNLTCTRAMLGALIGMFAFSVMPAYAEHVTDPSGDFLATYIGTKNGDMDALSSDVTFNPGTSTFTFSATVAGAIGTTAGGAWVWGLDRGKGTEEFLTNSPPFGAGVKFDSVVALFADKTGSFVNISGGGTQTSLSAGSVKVNGDTISATVPLSAIPSEGFAPQNYTWNFWPEQVLASPLYVSDFAPDARNATLTIVPEPASVLGLALGFLLMLIGYGRKVVTA
jgi:hypothetical protein